jgi:hypothetical protein
MSHICIIAVTTALDTLSHLLYERDAGIVPETNCVVVPSHHFWQRSPATPMMTLGPKTRPSRATRQKTAAFSPPGLTEFGCSWHNVHGAASISSCWESLTHSQSANAIVVKGKLVAEHLRVDIV